MNITPQRGRGGSGRLRTAALAAGAAAALACEYLLASSRDMQQSAISGELLNGGAAAEPGGFSAWLFNYFGSVSYFLPLLFIFFAWQLTKSRFSLRQVDFFTVGIRLLGFNILLMGLCALMSSLFVAGATGAGGILGDFLNILFFSKIPRPVAPLAPILLTLAGIMMFFAHSPWWFCDRIGEGVSMILRIDKGDEGAGRQKQEPEGKNAAEAAAAPQNAAAPGGLRLERRKVRNAAQPAAAEPPRSFDGKNSYSVRFTGGVTPDDAPIGTVQAQQPQRQKLDPEPVHGRVEPSFGDPEPHGIARHDDQAAGRMDDQRSAATRITVSDSAPSGIPGWAGSTMQAGRSPYGSEMQPQDRQAARDEAESGAGAGPSTIISRVEDQPPAQPDRQEQPGGYPYGAEMPDHEGGSDDDGGQSTIITMGGAGAAQDEQGSREEAEENDGPVYQAGAPGVKSETVGNPEGRGSVSTVITRGDSVTHMQFGQHVDGFSRDGREGGAYTERDSVASVPSDSGTLMDESIDGAGLGPITMEEGGFTVTPYVDEGGEEEEQDEDASFQDGGIKLKPHEDPISEKDRSFASSFTGATRGLYGKAEEPRIQPGSEQNSERDAAGEEIAAAAQAPHEADEDAKSVSAGEAGELEQEERAAFASAAADPENAAEGFDDYESEEEQEVTNEEEGGDSAAPSAEAGPRPAPEPPHADIHKFPTKEYHNSMITVPGNSEPEDRWRPSTTLLEPAEPSNEGEPEADARQTADAIDKCLREFGVDARVVDYDLGPVITCFHLLPGVGTRISKISHLRPDMCRVLGTPNLRVLGTIPGTQHIGLEVPNAHRKIISMREVAESDAFRNTKASLPLCLGENTVGETVVADLATAPHLLIAGTTGSGKSIGINGMLLSLLLSRSPSELRLILVDPKQVEFALYEGLPHLICPVISDPKETMAALEWCVAEMDRRYGILSAMRVRSLSEYNSLIREQNAQGRLVYDPAWSADMGGSPSQMKPLPSIVMVIDEFADLMQAFSSRRSGKGGPAPDMLVQRIAQKARAAGIHLMLATQSPRNEVITGTLKSNLPSRVAYTVGSALDSRVILDESGAENLLGYGDLLASIQHLNRSRLFRAHGPFARNEEVEAVVEAWKEHCGEPQYVEGVTDYQDEEDEESMQDSQQGPGKRDELYDRVLAHIRDYQNENGGRIPSITSVQIAFGIGYPRTKKILAQMKQAGDI